MLMSRQHLNFIVTIQYRLQSRRKWKTLRAQVAEGELIPVETSEWAAQIVVVHKRDGGISIYGNFKLTVNPVICPQVYPLPTPEEIFSTLANGESFSKLDLTWAYKQMKVKESSQPLLHQASLWCFNRPIIVAKSNGSSVAWYSRGSLLH